MGGNGRGWVGWDGDVDVALMWDGGYMGIMKSTYIHNIHAYIHI